MRIFPLFLFTCILGYFCTPLLLSALSKIPSTDATALTPDWKCMVHSQTAYFWPNFVTHLIMIHGAVSNGILPCSAIVFNPPAWSLSLEWQFYLVAPLAIIATRKLPIALITIAALTALYISYEFHVFGSFEQRSLLFAATPFFAIGIVSRIVYPKLAGSLRNPAIVLALLGMESPLGWQMAPFVVWGCIYVVLITDRRNLRPLDDTVIAVVSYILESRAALFIGRRSYSIYLCHVPLLCGIFYLLTSVNDRLSHSVEFASLLVTVVPIVFLVSCILYLAIERPGIIVGNIVVKPKVIRITATIRSSSIIGLSKQASHLNSHSPG